MFTQINDIEKLPKYIYKNLYCYEIGMHLVADYLCLTYTRRMPYKPETLFGVIVDGKRKEIKEDTYSIGHSRNFKEAVNMLYNYVINNPNIKVEQ